MQRVAHWAGRLGLWLAIVVTILAILSPIGYRLGWWGVPIALLQMIKWAIYLGIPAFVLSLIALVFGRGGARATSDGRSVRAAPKTSHALTGLVLSLIFGGFPLYQYSKVARLPYIHDITTDTEKPPAFVALAASRKAAPNGADYKGAEIAKQQKAAYPDVVPFDSKLPPAELFAKAESVARALNWEVVNATPAEGRLEATQTSLIYAFKDDVVLRIGPREGGSRLDIRSMSRVGRSDVGVNAARIRAYFDKLRAAGA
jgi:uncharacterized protein (DUF1499 family)